MSHLLNAVFRNDLAQIASLLDHDPAGVKEVEALLTGVAAF